MLRNVLPCACRALEVRGASVKVATRYLGGIAPSTLKYRVILKNGKYAIHEAFYDEEGEPWTCTEDPVCPAGDTLEAVYTTTSQE